MQIDESFIFAIASTSFFILVFRYLKTAILDGISSKINTIKNKFDEIISINEESEKLLKEYQSLLQSSKIATQAIIESSQNEIKQMKLQAEQEIHSKIESKTNIITNKIQNNEAKALLNLRLTAINIAISSSISLLNFSNNESAKASSTKEAMASISHILKESHLV